MPSAGDRRSPLYGLCAGLVVGADLLTKQAVEARFRYGEGTAVFGEWFQLRLVYNPGAAFGLHLGDHSRWIFLALALAAVLFLTHLAVRTPAS
ncbi:MAG TPA: signal peptidase II, partial [Gemmatimonadales bacterium]|nr:signal peptidase II [Gemmatimonadales bacterium]